MPLKLLLLSTIEIFKSLQTFKSCYYAIIDYDRKLTPVSNFKVKVNRFTHIIAQITF